MNTELEPWQADAMYEAQELWEEQSDETDDDERDNGDGNDNTDRDVRNEFTRTDIPSVSDPAVAWVSGTNRDGVSTRTRAKCGVLIERGKLAGQRCRREAGQGTVHYGAGSCVAHKGSLRRGRALGAWVMAHAFAQQLNINPWDALLMAVRIAAGKVAYIEYVLGQAKSDLELEGRAVVETDGGSSEGGPGGAQARLLVHPDTGEPLGVGEYRDLSWWVAKGELWHDRLAKTAKMAVDAGIAAWQVQKVEQEAQAIARVLNAVLEGLEGHITEEQAQQARAIMRSELLRLEDEERVSSTLDGVITSE